MSTAGVTISGKSSYTRYFEQNGIAVVHNKAKDWWLIYDTKNLPDKHADGWRFGSVHFTQRKAEAAFPTNHIIKSLVKLTPSQLI
jgi:hypothetical protein